MELHLSLWVRPFQFAVAACWSTRRYLGLKLWLLSEVPGAPLYYFIGALVVSCECVGLE